MNNRTMDVTMNGSSFKLARYNVEVDAPRPGMPISNLKYLLCNFTFIQQLLIGRTTCTQLKTS